MADVLLPARVLLEYFVVIVRNELLTLFRGTLLVEDLRESCT